MKNTALLRRRILSRRASVVVVGLDHAGVSLARPAVAAGFAVSGVDVADEKTSVTPSEGPTFGRDATAIAEGDVICICAPTPVREQKPDLTALERACTDVAEHLAPGRLVILESSAYPGTTEHTVKPLLEKSGLSADRDFLLACSPARIDPAIDEREFRSIPRVIGGATPEATGLAALFYGQLVEKVVEVSSCEAAEVTKLLEDTFRYVNVALVNEMAMLCHDIGMDVWEVLAASKLFGDKSFSPGPGVGGQYVWADRGVFPQRNGGRHLRMLEHAVDINLQMPGYLVSRIRDALNERGKAMKDARLLVLGVSRDQGDIDESPALRVIGGLQRSGARVSFHDPDVSAVQVNEKVRERTELTQRAVARADCVVLLEARPEYNLEWIARHASLIFDSRNAYGSRRPANVIPL